MAELGCKGLRTHRMKEQVSGLQSARQSEQRSLFRPGHRDTKAIKGRQSRQGQADVGAVQKPNTAGKGNFVANCHSPANTCNLNWHFIEPRILP